MVSYDKIPEIYFLEGLIARENPEKVLLLISDNQVILICAAITILSIALIYFQIYFFNKK